MLRTRVCCTLKGLVVPLVLSIVWFGLPDPAMKGISVYKDNQAAKCRLSITHGLRNKVEKRAKYFNI